MNEPRINRARIISRITTWALRLTVAGTILFFLLVLVAAMLGGNGDLQRSSLESVIGGFFGHKAKIAKLNSYELLPTLRVDLENLALVDENEKPLLILEHLQYAHDPLQRYMGGEPLLDLQVKNLLTAPGYLGPYSLHFMTSTIKPLADNVTEGETTLELNGNYGGYDLAFTLPLHATRNGNYMRYNFLGTSPMTLNIGNIHTSFMFHIQGVNMVFDQITITSGDRKIMGTVIVPGGATPGPTVMKLWDEGGTANVDGSMSTFGKNITYIGKVTGANENLARVVTDMLRVLTTVRQADDRGHKIEPANIDATLEFDQTSAKNCAGTKANDKGIITRTFKNTNNKKFIDELATCLD